MNVLIICAKKGIPLFGGGWGSINQKVIVASSNPRQASHLFFADTLHFSQLRRLNSQLPMLQDLKYLLIRRIVGLHTK